MNPEQFVQELSKYNFRLTDEQKKQFKLYFKDLLTANEHVNLTRITEEDDVYLKHFFDSLTPLFTFKKKFLKKMLPYVMLVLVRAFHHYHSKFCNQL